MAPSSRREVIMVAIQVRSRGERQGCFIGGRNSPPFAIRRRSYTEDMSDHARPASGNRADVREFLISRRARITPDQAGLPVAGRRRVPGLRREEVAMLAGVSVDWYTRLE